MTHPKYRPDIDGLRAVAVLAVVGFHAFPTTVKGGFVGVDVFFVISGFLISTIIIGDLDRGRFSFVDFYARRVIRLFPALLLVLAACFAFGWFTLFSSEYKQLGKHIAGGASFISNLLLWNESGYFDNAAEAKPLLHLWSLGVEEQFYLVWPISLWLAWTRRLNLLAIALTIGAISFTLNIYQAREFGNLVSAFYSLQTRFWELMSGAVLAYLTLHRSAGTPRRNVLSWLGALSIFVGILVITKEREFPGWWALLPVVGSVLIIAAGAQAWLNRVVLSNRVLVWFGLISYPLYLWHWPLLSFSRILEGEIPSRAWRIFAVLLSVFLAWCTYRFVETPIRLRARTRLVSMQHRVTDRRALILCTMMLVVGLAGFAGYHQDGFAFRQDDANSELSELDWDKYFQVLARETSDCLPTSIREKALRHRDGTIRCRQTVAENPLQTIAIIGDSHAEHLFLGMGRQVGRQQNLVYFTYSCLPFLGLTSPGKTECENMQKALEYLIGQPSIRAVILSSYWADRSLAQDIRSLHDLENIGRAITFKNHLRVTLQALVASGKTVVFAYDVPNLGFAPLRCVRPIPSFVTRGMCAVPRIQLASRESRYRELVDEVLAEYPQVKRWDPAEYLCRDGACPIVMDGRLLYKDVNYHITTYASEYLAGSLMRVISSNAENPAK